MIGHISGKIIWADPENLIISANGIGYEISYFNNISSSEFASEKSLFISHKISEYGQTLFGFDTIIEKIIFEELSNIKGIGARAVFSIMSSLKINSYSQLATLKLDQLVAVKGVGKGIAQKLLLGVSTKLKKDFVLEATGVEQDSKKIEKEYEDVINMLIEWGYKKKDLVAFFAENNAELNGKTTEKIIEFTLRKLK